MRRFILVSAAIAAIGISAFLASDAFAAQGSGKSATHRNDNFVVICHYDRNQQGPNAGPHTITINANALDHHLANHVKAAGFVGDDHVGECIEPTATAAPTLVPTSTATPTSVPATGTPTSVPATATPTPQPAATDTPTPQPAATDTPTPTDTPIVAPATDTPTPEPTATDTPTPEPTLPPD